jgi:hypothetical protein
VVATAHGVSPGAPDNTEALQAALTAAGLEGVSVTPAEPSLEDVFLALAARI